MFGISRLDGPETQDQDETVVGVARTRDSLLSRLSRRVPILGSLAFSSGLVFSGCAGDDAPEKDPCAVDTDCLRGEFCDVVELQCMPEPEQCRKDSDCGAGEVCAEGVCGSENVTTDATTTEGTTGSGTDTTGTGTTGETDGVECVEDLDCGEGEVCDQNVCVPDMEDLCEGVTCGDNASCNGGECECDEGFSEEEGVCEEVNNNPPKIIDINLETKNVFPGQIYPTSVIAENADFIEVKLDGILQCSGPMIDQVFNDCKIKAIGTNNVQQTISAKATTGDEEYCSVVTYTTGQPWSDPMPEEVSCD